ncbi:MAG: transglutaminase-like cysteine peptidase [Thermotogota bacterium]|nr:transglutaminase-like cysteine peptidase [Thermotogota bacterium]
MSKKFWVVLVGVLIVSSLVAGLILLFSQLGGITPSVVNNAPSIDSYDPSYSNPELVEGDTLTFSISATDPDGDNITCSWKLSNHIVFQETLTQNHTRSSWAYHSELRDRGEHLVDCTVSDGRGGVASVDWRAVVHFVELQVAISNPPGEWVRDATTDLPCYHSTVSYSVSNLGDALASDVKLIASSEEETLIEKTVSINPNGDSYSDKLYVTVMYDSSTSLSLQASCGVASDMDNFEISAKLPRIPVSSSIKKLYITPNDPFIQSTVDEIFEDKAWWDTRADWKVLCDHVKDGIEYEYDTNLFGKMEYWQLPRETLTSGKGDCEDQAILLCTLLRARGYGPEDVFVIIGVGEEAGHAWVVFKVLDVFGYEVWRYLEPTSSFWGSGVFDLLAQLLGYYENEYGGYRVLFNDQKYETP